jgi:hypothetical protein
VNFITLKFMKIRWYSTFFGSFAHHFQIKLSAHGLNLNSIFVSMNELEFFLLKGVWTQNSNTMELVKFLEKTQILHIQIIAVRLKMTSCRTMSRKQKLKKSDNPRFYRPNRSLFSTLTFSPWAILAISLYVEIP